MKSKYKWIFALLLLFIIIAFGFTFTVKEGYCGIVTRFGAVRTIHMDTGLHFKLPWPFEKVLDYDRRSQYSDSGYTETLTSDKKNIILQTYMIWRIEEPLQYHNTIGDAATASKYLNDLTANVKNGILGNYPLSSLVNTDRSLLRINQISEEIEAQVRGKALTDYGISLVSLKVKRLALPDANLKSVFDQMIADRQKHVTQLNSEANRDSAIIRSEADAKAAQIIAKGMEEAAIIDGETERMVAAIYGDAYGKNPELFTFLKKLIALENSVNENTVIVMRSSDSPLDILGN